MFRRLGHFYSRRIVNVNVNIVLAGLLALGPTLLVVRLAEHLLAAGVVSPARLHIGANALITVVTFLADLFFDVGMYYLLHWLANHSHKANRQERLEVIAEAAVENVPFFRDATKVQIQRMVLSPILYILFLGGQFTLMTLFQFRPVWATIVGFAVGIGVARTLHTFWMLGEARGRAAVLAGKVCGKCGYDLSRIGREFDRCPECGQPIPRPAPTNGPPPGPPPGNPPLAARTAKATEQERIGSAPRA
jgi:hypothetical protein